MNVPGYLLPGIAAMLLGCGPSESDSRREALLKDEAREVGFAMGLAERCGLDHQWSRGVPTKYDDSLSGGPLHEHFVSGYAEANSLERPCVFGIQGRPARRR